MFGDANQEILKGEGKWILQNKSISTIIYNMVIFNVKISIEISSMLCINVSMSSMLYCILSNSWFGFGRGPTNMFVTTPYNIKSAKYTRTTIN
jgi:hypothetical protein